MPLAKPAPQCPGRRQLLMMDDADPLHCNKKRKVEDGSACKTKKDDSRLFSDKPASTHKKKCKATVAKPKKVKSNKLTPIKQQAKRGAKPKEKPVAIAKAMRLSSGEPKDKHVKYIIKSLQNAKIDRDVDFSLPLNAACFTIGSDYTGLGTEVIAASLAGLNFKSLFGSDIDPGVRHLHQLLHPSLPALKSDCAKRSVAETPYVDLYVAGPPCQPWSSMGRNMGLDDMKARGIVFYHVLAYVRTKHLRAVIIENVKGLLVQHKRMFAVVLQILRDAGYMVSWELVNTQDHGIPHSRPRLFIVGILKTSCANSFKFPKKLHFRPPIDCFLKQSRSEWAPMLNPTGQRNVEKAQLKLTAAGIDMTQTTVLVDLSASQKFASFRVGACPCLTASRGKVGGYYISNQRRMTSIQEMGRLQGFPTKLTDTLLQRGAKPALLGHAYGNAMSVNVLMRIIPRVAWAAGLLGDTGMVGDVWKRMKKTKNDFWSKCELPEAVLHHVPLQPTPLSFVFNPPIVGNCSPPAWA